MTKILHRERSIPLGRSGSLTLQDATAVTIDVTKVGEGTSAVVASGVWEEVTEGPAAFKAFERPRDDAEAAQEARRLNCIKQQVLEEAAAQGLDVERVWARTPFVKPYAGEPIAGQLTAEGQTRDSLVVPMQYLEPSC
ncbi:unnamed protein product [Vitrella brassicaformis CCMP3155]|uniref:Uncharacterized protein n=1 Tax=Vitrella brassicaformis (strain CCMP3155) TaxID=1169540 RepID=A0A0G4H1G3_VITBC|nr:unnamed protein product [Vitrella brassicaformis CCMP3155]|eukprot:CEM37436.1 unnamed protein product [Vitrella brassicaformis CCMP3155]